MCPSLAWPWGQMWLREGTCALGAQGYPQHSMQTLVIFLDHTQGCARELCVVPCGLLGLWDGIT